MMVEVGDTVTMRDWLGEWITVKVDKMGSSPEFGDTVEGRGTNGEGFRALPLSHLIETAKVLNIGRGKWNLALPDGSTERVKSLAKAKAYCEDHGLVLVEE